MYFIFFINAVKYKNTQCNNQQQKRKSTVFDSKPSIGGWKSAF